MYKCKHGLITYIDAKAKCRLLKQIAAGAYQSLWNGDTVSSQSWVGITNMTLTFSLVQLYPPYPPPLPCVKVTDIVLLGGGGGGLLSPVEDQILQEFNTLYVTRFRIYKIATPHQQKPRRGGDLRQI